ncbi:MAG: glycosyltransferase family 39 protein, partial [Acetobacteraceae bacterium]|nr:glycosyltransferase family 39 protein [Acetobacteraceae bacterium]
VVAALLLFRLARDVFDDDVALWAVAFLGFYPGSLFLSAGYTEALTLVWILACFLMLQQARFLIAAVFAALALASRSTGIALVPVLLWALWRHVGCDVRRLALHGGAVTAIALSGLAMFMLYQWRAFSDPLAFSHAQAAWGVPALREQVAAVLTLRPLWHVQVGASPSGLNVWVATLVVVAIVAGWNRLPSSMTVFMLGVLLLPILVFAASSGFESMVRFELLSFPVFLVLPVVLRCSALRIALLALFSGLLGLYSALFSQWFWVA